MSEEENSMTVKEAADALGVHQSTIIRAVKDGRLHAVIKRSPIGKRATAYLLSREEVENLAKGQPEQEQTKMIAETPSEYRTKTG